MSGLELVAQVPECIGERRRGEDGQRAARGGTSRIGTCRGGRAGATTGVTAAGEQYGGREDQTESEFHCGAGTSTTTLVDFTTATASTPGSRPSSSAACAVISETTRCGPACISTFATIWSAITEVT